MADFQNVGNFDAGVFTRSWAVLRRPALLLPWTQQALRLVAHS